MYHGLSRSGGHGTISVTAFERQMRFLSRFCHFINFDQLNETSPAGQKRILLTFDDGYHNNFLYAVPILRRLNIPAIFFVSHRHCQDGQYLWFSYLKALDGFYKEPEIVLRNNRFDLRGRDRQASIQAIRSILLGLKPHPSAMYKAIDLELPRMESFVPQGMISEYFSGMAPEELKTIAQDELFTLGVHTADHAFLTRCTSSEARSQLRQNIDFLKDITGIQPSVVAYPSGDYDENSLQICREENLLTGFSVIPMRRAWNHQDIPRMGIYGSSLVKLMIKVTFADQLRSLNIKVG